MKFKITACLMLLSSVCLAQEVLEKPIAKVEVKQKLRAELSVWTPYLGTWVIDTKLKDGQPLWAKKHYKVGMGGNFLMVETFAKDTGGKAYQQSHTLWRWSPKSEKVLGHRFMKDGGLKEGAMTIDGNGNREPSISAVFAAPGSPVAVVEKIKLIDEKSYHWEVSSSVGKENPIMEGVWRKQ